MAMTPAQKARYDLEVNSIQKKLAKKIRQISNDSETGMLLAGQVIMGASIKKAPVEFGLLRSSHYALKQKSATGSFVEVGATASYAVPVHERVDVQHNEGEAKFLQNAIAENKDDILKLVKQKAKLQ